MIRPATLLALLADALVCVALGIGIPLLIGAVGWLANANWTTTPWPVVATVASAIWALGLGGGVGVTIAPGSFPTLQLTEPFVFVISLAPLAFAVLIASFGWRAGRRLQDSDFPWLGLAAATVAFAAAATASLQFARGPVVRIDVWGAVVTGTLIWLAAMLIGMRAWNELPWHRRFGAAADGIRDRCGEVVRIAGGYLVGLLGLASLALLVSAVLGFGRVIAPMQALHLDVAGAIGLGLLHLAYAPTLIVWAASWLLGPGVALGAGAIANPGGTATGPLPAVPLFGLIPEGESPLWWAVLALPVLLAAVVVLADRICGRLDDDSLLGMRLVTPAAAALVAAAALALFAHLGRGALGPGRLTDFGPSPLWVFLAALGCFALGGAAGVLLPLSAITLDTGSRERATDADRSRSSRASVPGGAARGADHGAHGSDRASAAGAADTIDLGEVRERTRGREVARRDEPGELRPHHRAGELESTSPTSRAIVSTGDGPASDAGRGERAQAPRRDDASRSPLSGADRQDARGDASASDRDEPSTAAPRTDKPSKRRSTKPELTDVLRRPDEPDIYADLDDL